MAMFHRAGERPFEPLKRGGITLRPRDGAFDADGMIGALGLLLEVRGMAAEARFLAARVDSKGRVTLRPDLPPTSARLERVRAWRAARSFALALEGIRIPARLTMDDPEPGPGAGSEPQAGGTEKS